MANSTWWKSEDEILKVYKKSDSYSSTKELPPSCIVKHSETLYKLEVAMGVAMTLLPWILLIRTPDWGTGIACGFISIMGLLIISVANQKKKNHNYILNSEGISMNDRTIKWSEIIEVQEVKTKKGSKMRNCLCIITQSDKIDIWLSSELRPSPKVFTDYVEHMLNRVEN